MLLSLLSLCVLGYKMSRSKAIPFDSVCPQLEAGWFCCTWYSGEAKSPQQSWNLITKNPF